VRASCVSLGAPCGFSCPLFVCRAGCAARPVRSRYRLRECAALLPCWCCFSGPSRCPLACLALALPPFLPLGAGCALRCRRRRVLGLSCPALLLSENYFAVRLPPGPRPGVASPPRVPAAASALRLCFSLSCSKKIPAVSPAALPGFARGSPASAPCSSVSALAL
jgi:hypothetical protein